MKKLKQIVCFLMLFLPIAMLQAQTVTEVIGKVVDETNEPLPGVTVFVKNTKNGTVTNYDGRYVIRVPSPNAVLIFTFVGMEKQEVNVGGRKTLNVTLKSSSVQLNEVVSVGYNTMKRKDLTGSVVSVDTKEIAKVPANNLAQAIAGRVSGVLVNQSEGEPGAAISIRVRGGMSITGDNEPLYIIDGFPSEQGLDGLDPGSIESIDILKDASSTAIYGARGANGVVVVTTKAGTGTKTSVSYETYWGIKKMARYVDVFNPKEFVLLDYERRDLTSADDINSFVTNYGDFSQLNPLYDNRKGINWQEEAFGQPAYTQSHRVSISGGAGKLRYNTSYNYLNDQGQMIESGIRKHNFRIKLDQEINNKLKVSLTTNYSEITVFGMGSSDGSISFNPLTQILSYRPTIGVLGKDEDLVNLGEDPILADDQGNAMQNPVLSAKEENRKKMTSMLQLNGGFTYTILKGLSFQNTVGYSSRVQRQEVFYGAQSIQAKRTSINGAIRYTENKTFQTSNVLNYQTSVARSKFTFMLGQEYISNMSRWVEASAYNFPNDDIGLADLSLGASPGIPRSYYNDDDKLLSFFARAYYNYADKYMVTMSLRADGSSKFGHKWGYFPSVSFAWRASEEPFVKDLNIFSDLKIRLGYGDAGNNRIGSYGSLAIMSSVTYPLNNATATGYAPSQIPNPNLKWEANRTMNLGFDLGFFDQRLMISPELYINRSSNLLLNTTLPKSSGYVSMIQNIGKTENRGIDLTVTSVNIKSKKFEWTTNLNISHNENKVIALSGEQSFLRESGFGFNQNDYIVKVGDPIGEMYGYKTIGLYQVSDFNYNSSTQTYQLKDGIPYDNRKKPQPGYWKYANIGGAKDADGNLLPEITDDDRTVIGNANPVIYGGINNTFTYRNVDLSIFMNYSVGNDVLNATKLYNVKIGRLNRNGLDLANSSHRWVTIDAAGNRVTDPDMLTKMNAGKTVAQYGNLTESDTYIHSWAVEDGSFLRLNNVTLGYSLPDKLIKKLGLSKCRLYATASNLYLFTKYTGYDPESSTRNSTGLTPGVDWGAYPRSRTLVFGINVVF